MATVPTKLPAPVTRFVGRETELAQAAALLAEARLLTLTGSGGAGKTRLALRLAATVAEHFPNGVWFVDFSPLPGGKFAWDQVAMTLGVKDPGRGKTWAETVGRFLAPRQALWAWPGRVRELQRWLQAATDRTEGLSPRLRARVRNLQCFITVARETFAKLGIDSRSELVAEAMKRGIQPQPSRRS